MGPPLADAAWVEDRVGLDDADPGVDVLASVRADRVRAVTEVPGSVTAGILMRLLEGALEVDAGAGVGARVDDESARARCTRSVVVLGAG